MAGRVAGGVPTILVLSSVGAIAQYPPEKKTPLTWFGFSLLKKELSSNKLRLLPQEQWVTL